MILVKIIREIEKESLTEGCQKCEKINFISQELGDDFKCQLKCFEIVPDVTKKTILQTFNLMASADERDSYLCALISVRHVAWRRNIKLADEASANPNTE